MSVAPRLLLAGLTVALVAFLLRVTVVPTHVSFGAGSLLRNRRTSGSV